MKPHFRTPFLALLIALLASFALGWRMSAQDARFEGTVAAPDFPSGLDWFNVEQPISLSALRGKVVLLDFWTYGCINCIHMIPVLRQLEEKYPNELVVIGVHSAKFANEGVSDNIRQIVQRYDVHHPVVNDRDFVVWRSYGARAWPTLVLIDPRGKVVAMDAGEIPFEALDTYTGGMIAYYDALGTNELDRTPLALALEGASNPGTPLLFPGKVLADVAGNRLFIADTNHHRIVIADLETYAVLDVIGVGARGFVQGGYDEARFDQPQGMAVQGDMLYIADVNNHAIRAVDLRERRVSTVAGDGRMSRTLAPFGYVVNNPLKASLRSPWDVTFGANPDELHIAMAGMHQLHVLNLRDNVIVASVGNGREAMLNDRLGTSELAQPSGLFYRDGWLYFADSESSTIRAANFSQDRVTLISGTDENNLFDFGDVDGIVGVSRLQHALAVTGAPEGGLLYIADTYNNKLKAYDPETGITRTLLGGEAGYRDGGADVARFYEPGGLSLAGNRLFVADTNNHAIRVVDTATLEVSTLAFPNPERLALRDVVVVGGNRALGESVAFDAQTVQAGDGDVTLSLILPEGYKINPLIASFVVAESDGEAVRLSQAQTPIASERVTLSARFTQGTAELTLNMTVYYCEAVNESVCLIEDVVLRVPVVVSATAEGASVALARTITLPEAYR